MSGVVGSKVRRAGLNDQSHMNGKTKNTKTDAETHKRITNTLKKKRCPRDQRHARRQRQLLERAEAREQPALVLGLVDGDDPHAHLQYFGTFCCLRIST